MTDRPIIFSAPMVRALLAERKTQTRRLASSPLSRCAVGDRLYVRESAAIRYTAWHHAQGDSYSIEYAANLTNGQHNGAPLVGSQVRIGKPPKHFPSRSHNADGSLRWCPAIHLPRWASRLTLTIESVRTEPLNAISEADAIAEGLRQHVPPADRGMPHYVVDGVELPQQVSARLTYAALWDSLHIAPGQRWQDNPEALVLTFSVGRGNIDG